MKYNTFREKQSKIPFKDKKRKIEIFVGVFLQAIFLFLFFSFLAHVFYHKDDQAYLESIKTIGLRAASKNIKNYMGVMGAMSANLFIYRTFGISAFFFICPLFFVGYRLLTRNNLLSISLIKVFLVCSFLGVWISIFLGYLAISYTSIYNSSWSNLIGRWSVMVTTPAKDIFGWGIVCVLLVAFVMFSLCFIDIPDRTNKNNKDVFDQTKEDLAPYQDSLDIKKLKSPLLEEDKSEDQEIVDNKYLDNKKNLYQASNPSKRNFFF